MLTAPVVGDMEVTVAAVALLTVNGTVTFTPSEFRIKIFHVPEAIPFRLKFLLSVVAVSVVVVVAPVTVTCPVFVRVTADPLKPVPTISMVCQQLFDALVGEMLVIVGAEVPVAVKVTGEPTGDAFFAVRVLVPGVEPRIQLPTVAIQSDRIRCHRHYQKCHSKEEHHTYQERCFFHVRLPDRLNE